MPVAIATIQKLQNFALQPMEISKLYNSVPVKDNCALFALTPYFRARAMQWCHVNFSFEDPCCHGNQPFLFKDKRWNAAARLYSVAMGQIPRSTERISSNI